MEPALKPSQVAEQLGVSVATVYRWIEQRRLAHFRYRGVVRIARRDLEAFVTEHRIESVP